MNVHSHIFTVLLFLTEVAGLHSQPKEPTEFLAKIPRPPRTLAEAFSRCPAESDTLIANALEEMRNIMRGEHHLLVDDSLKASKRKLSQEDEDVLTTLRTEIAHDRQIHASALERYMGEGVQELFNEVKLIGDLLDRDIKSCPKVGDRRIADSECVERAETTASGRRRDASDRFLQQTREFWQTRFDTVLPVLAAGQDRIGSLIAQDKKPEFVFRLRRLRLQLWNTVDLFLKSVDEITRLAVQFSR